METLGLTRRRRQLELLARACARGEPAQIRRPRSAAKASENTTLLALEDDGILLYWPHDATADSAASGVELDVRFSIDGRSFEFRSPSRGRVERQLDTRGSVSALKLALPLRIDPAQRRPGPQLRFPTHDLPRAEITSVADREQRVSIRLSALSATSAAACVSAASRDTLQRGTHYWLELKLFEYGGPLELIVRLAAIESLPNGELTLGFVICAGDDGTHIIDALDRVALCLGVRTCDGITAPAEEPEGAAC